MAKQRGVTFYRLPQYYREINLIELVWSEMKRHVAVNGTQFSASFMNSH
jgi:transposase